MEEDGNHPEDSGSMFLLQKTSKHLKMVNKNVFFFKKFIFFHSVSSLVKLIRTIYARKTLLFLLKVDRGSLGLEKTEKNCIVPKNFKGGFCLPLL